MKLKLIINGTEANDDYKLLKTTISTVASIRKTFILKFDSERLVIISTPKSISVNNGTVLQQDVGQLWCTIPRDVFKLYNVKSARDLNNITMESNSDSLSNVFKRYDKVINQGSSTNMTIKLQDMPEWNLKQNSIPGYEENTRPNPVCALAITFEEIVNTSGPEFSAMNHENDMIDDNMAVATSNSNKVIVHSFKIPVKLLFKTQVARIQEPMINYENLIMYNLPSMTEEFGSGFYNFMRRVERYSNVNHIRLSGAIKKDKRADDNSDNLADLKIIINELDWHLEICWNGPLNYSCNLLGQDETEPSSNAQQSQNILNSNNDENIRDTPINGQLNIENSLEVEDSAIGTLMNSKSHDTETNNNTQINYGMDDIAKMIQEKEANESLTHEVIIKSKDWKVCSKLYSAFEEVILAISHNDSCAFHCSLDRGNVDTGNNDSASEQPRERGQIIYYMARSKAI
ncbi:hypothetical protein TPHA_0F02730 [Tetrapisispora phaffii CBS 4417]|uniref:Checkpoint protein n=1 Tax=Tetrapisispora phaffii (strain ATCC 24235 / CBS 4417 / NBRC 1672 / NRRL Y-8282 / UCD 70-5) TaxID=1071381 RepID=G8BUG7_TETPH|nr:hypothetical protein TPHA_0F02730 [Tetrapisispora phaffii CBS 4417]CCE63753.1 hypothetical protein TPHA_0F02730 [Tetrapisispora phaffii CBS 4417]